MSTFVFPKKTDLQQTAARIAPHIHRTPVLQSRLINRLAKADVYFKCENFQRGGSFKIRGASNAILQLPEAQREKGVVTHSSGNFAQGLSLAAQSVGIPAYIVMPYNAPAVKQAAACGYGAKVRLCPPTLFDREAAARRIQVETGATLVHPSNDDAVILGQATASMELLEEQPDLDIIVSPVGGGGFAAGMALAVRYFGKNAQAWGAEPEHVDDAFRSLQSGRIESNERTDTIADGLRTQLGDRNFPILQRDLSGIIRVSEAQIISAMQLIWERMKIIVEPSSAVTLAAVLGEAERFAGKKIGLLISGGNVDVKRLPF